MRDLAFFSIFAPLTFLSFYSAHLSVLIWIWIALLPPGDMLYGTFSGLPFNKLIAVITFSTVALSREKKDFYFDGLMLVVSLYAVIVTASYLFPEYEFSFADSQFDKFWKELVLFFLLTGIVYSRHRIHQVLIVFSIAFGFLMVKEGLIFLLTAGGHKIVGMGVVGDNNGVALALLMTIPITLYCAKYSLIKSVRIVFYSVVALGTVTVIATYSRGGFVGLLVLGFMTFKGSKYKFRALALVIVLVIILYSLMPDDYLSRVNTISDATSDESFATRLLAWKINTQLALKHPFLGVGLFGCVDYRNWIAEMPTARTWLFESPLVLRSFVAHSIYFQALGDTGFTGLMLFISILLMSLYKTFKTERISRNNPDLLWLADLAKALRMSMVVYMVSGAALSLLYFEPLYILLALCSRVHRLAKTSKAEVINHGRAQISSLAF